jgi:exodeoxyribonuclease VII large subunit
VDSFPSKDRMNPGADLSGSEGGPPVLTVSGLNQAVARALERGFPLLWVRGEVSNFTRAASGHWYFTLKDDGGQVRAVMFRSRAQLASFTPREGDRIEVRALVTLYAPRGDYQLSVEAIRRAGVGSLYEAFLALKDKLGKEGLFDAQRKRPLPRYAPVIGIVTSPQAAALRDVLSTLARRAPHAALILYPTPVQGEGAGEKIAAAITTASVRAECDLLLVCRGGGSIEDLWAFNHEAVARAIAACAVPVISGVGHETDFTIADFVADLRAPTPTAAAELAATPRAEWLAQLQQHAARMSRALQRKLAEHSQTLDRLARRLSSPGAAIARHRLAIKTLHVRLRHGSRAPLDKARFGLAQLRTRLSGQRPNWQAQRRHLAEQARRATACTHAHLRQRRHALGALTAQLEALSPHRTLERGYAIVATPQGDILRDPAQVQAGAALDITLAEGTVSIEVARAHSPR